MYKVEIQACVWITLKDKTRLAAKIWKPVTAGKDDGEGNEKFPAILGK